MFSRLTILLFIFFAVAALVLDSTPRQDEPVAELPAKAGVKQPQSIPTNVAQAQGK